jgi:hypothetical protein
MLAKMLFSVVFAGAVLDALVNGPKLVGWRLYLVAALALLAVVLQESLGFILVEAVIIALFAESAVSERRSKKEAAEAAKAKALAAKAPEDDRELPEAIRKLMEKAREYYLKNLNGGSTNAYGGEWKLMVEDSGVQVFQSDFPGHKCKFWKVEAEVTADFETLKRELVDYDLRCRWDTGLLSGKIIKRFNKIPDLGDPTLDIVYTQPAAGGMVASREIIDVGIIADADGGFDYINCTLPSPLTLKEIPKKAVGERAFSHLGSGMSVKPVGGVPHRYKYTLITALDLGGWLPTGVINSATTGALLDGTKAMLTHMASKTK